MFQLFLGVDAAFPCDDEHRFAHDNAVLVRDDGVYPMESDATDAEHPYEAGYRLVSGL